MALVPNSTIERWFQTDSWVYKNFAFFFNNPLWSKSVPKGFSLCPYFWLALFTLFVVRPFVYTLSFINFAVDKSGVKISPKAVLVSVVALAALAVVSLLGYMFFIIGQATYQDYKSVGALWALWSPILLAATLLFVILYKDFTGTKCKVENYVRVLTVVLVGLSFVLYTDGAIFSFLSVPVAIVIGFFKLLWIAITAIGGFIWYLISYFGNFVWQYKIATVVAFSALGVFSLIGYIFDKTYTQKPENVAARKRRLLLERNSDYLIDEIEYVTIYTKSYLVAYIKHNQEFVDLVIKHTNLLGEFYDSIDGWVAVREEAEKLTEKIVTDIQAKRSEKEKIKLERCKKVTNNLEKIWAPFTKVAVWLIAEVMVFFKLLWALWKARKQGICPYMRFKEVEKK